MKNKNNLVLDNRALLRMFQCAINRHPMLSEEQAAIMARQAQAGDQKAADLFVKSHLRLVLKVAFQYWRPGLPSLNLISEGCLELLKASEKFDPDRGVRFSSYAFFAVNRRVSRAADSHYRHSGNSLNELACNDGDETTFKGPLSASGDREEDERIFDQQILKLISDLDELEQRILILRFWNNFTFEKISERVGISVEHIRRVEIESLQKLRWTRGANDAATVPHGPCSDENATVVSLGT